MANQSVQDIIDSEKVYEAGFITDVESETLPPGIDENVVRHISRQKNEPKWLTDWRLRAFKSWQSMSPPVWGHIDHPEIDYQKISYYSAPKSQLDGPKSLDEVDPELLATYEKLGIPLHEQAVLAGVVQNSDKNNVAVDVV